MWGWSRAAAARASWWRRRSACSLSAVRGGSSLSATLRPRTVSSATNTSPIPPAPILSRIRYWDSVRGSEASPAGASCADDAVLPPGLGGVKWLILRGPRGAASGSDDGEDLVAPGPHRVGARRLEIQPEQGLRVRRPDVEVPV